jgi:hypothetical protein
MADLSICGVWETAKMTEFSTGTQTPPAIPLPSLPYRPENRCFAASVAGM